MPAFDWTNWSYNGLSFGSNTALQITTVEGLIEALPEVRSTDVARSGDHGFYQGQDLLGERTVALGLLVYSPTAAGYLALLQTVALAFQVQATELALNFNGGLQCVFCRPRRRRVPWDPQNVGLLGEASIELVASDPRIYSTALHSLSALVPSSPGSGVAFPVVFPAAFGAPASGGMVTPVNAGTFPSPWTATITGPCTSPSISNNLTGQTMTALLTLGVGDVLLIDFGNRTIVLNATASRRSSMSVGSSWWSLVPGSTPMTFSANAASGQLTASWRDAYL
jgi:hypothetical protein